MKSLNPQRYSNGDRILSRMVYFVFDLRKKKLKLESAICYLNKRKVLNSLIF